MSVLIAKTSKAIVGEGEGKGKGSNKTLLADGSRYLGIVFCEEGGNGYF